MQFFHNFMVLDRAAGESEGYLSLTVSAERQSATTQSVKEDKATKSAGFQGDFSSPPLSLEWQPEQAMWDFGQHVSVLGKILRLRRQWLCFHWSYPVVGNLLPIHYSLFTPLLANICEIFRSTSILPYTCMGKLALGVMKNSVVWSPREPRCIWIGWKMQVLPPLANYWKLDQMWRSLSSEAW